MTENLDPGTATRAALAEEIDRLRSELEHARAALAGDNEGIRLWMLDCGLSAQNAREQRDEARRDLAAATTALQRIRELCDEMARSNFYAASPRGLVKAIRDALDAAGADPAATGGET